MDIEINSNRLAAYTTAAGGMVINLIEFTNTGTVPYIWNDLQLEVLDASESLLKVVNMVSVYPNVIDPGDKGYVCTTVYNTLTDTAFGADQIGQVVMRSIPTAHAPRKEIDVEITDASLSEKLGMPSLLCRVTNNGSEALSLLTIACPVYSADGTLLTVITHTLPSLAPGENAAIDQMALEFDNSADYTGATIEPFAFVQEIF